MATIREMLDSPEDHPGLFRAVFGVNMTIRAGGPGSGRRPGQVASAKVHQELTNKGFVYKGTSHNGTNKYDEYKHRTKTDAIEIHPSTKLKDLDLD